MLKAEDFGDATKDVFPLFLFIYLKFRLVETSSAGLLSINSSLVPSSSSASFLFFSVLIYLSLILKLVLTISILSLGCSCLGTGGESSTLLDSLFPSFELLLRLVGK